MLVMLFAKEPLPDGKVKRKSIGWYPTFDVVLIKTELKIHEMVATGSLRTGPSWCKPASMGREQWVRLIDQCWEDLGISPTDLLPFETDLMLNWIGSFSISVFQKIWVVSKVSPFLAKVHLGRCL